MFRINLLILLTLLFSQISNASPLKPEPIGLANAFPNLYVKYMEDWEWKKAPWPTKKAIKSLPQLDKYIVSIVGFSFEQWDHWVTIQNPYPPSFVCVENKIEDWAFANVPEVPTLLILSLGSIFCIKFNGRN